MLHRLLIVDHRATADTILRKLREGGRRIESRRVDSRSGFVRALDDPFDLIISNVTLPSFDVIEALALRDEHAPGTPVLVVTEAGGEEIAVDCMKHGAADFLRFEQLARLPEVADRLVRAPLEGTAPEAPVERSPGTLRAAISPAAAGKPSRQRPTSAAEVVFRLRLEPHLQCDYMGPAILALTGYAPTDFYRDPYLFFQLCPDDARSQMEASLQGAGGAPGGRVFEWINPNGTSRWVDIHFERTGSPAPTSVRGHVRDVTDLVAVEETLKRQESLVHLIRDLAAVFDASDWRRPLVEWFEEIGHAARVSRVALAENEHDAAERLRYRVTASWPEVRSATGEEVSTLLDRDLPGSWRSILSRGAVVAGPAHQFCTSEGEPLARGGVRSIALAPVFARGAWWGTLLVEDARRAREWSAAETNALRTLATLFGSGVEHEHASGERPVRFLRPARKIQGPEIVPGHDGAFLGEGSRHSLVLDGELRSALEAILDRMTATIGGDAITVLLVDEPGEVLSCVASRGFAAIGPHEGRVRLGQDLTGRLARDRCRLHIPNLEAVAPTSPRAAAFAKIGFKSYYAVPLVGAGSLKGVIEVLHVRAHCPESEWITLLEALAGRVILAIEKSELVNTLNQSNAEIQLAYDSTLEGWTRALDLRDRETEGHTRRVTEMTLALAEALGDSDLDFVNLRRGALLHDIGKMGIPDRILHKPGPLDEQEWATMKLHPVYAYEMLSPIDYLRPAVEIPYGHHERWDGGGYPRGLRGSEIPKAARVFAVADVWDALRSDRPYRKSWSEDRARGYIELNAEVQFDPRVVDAFLSKEVYKKPLTAGR